MQNSDFPHNKLALSQSKEIGEHFALRSVGSTKAIKQSFKRTR
jgi:hypothetical protein